MATTLYFVQSDTLPQIKLTLTDEDTDLPKNLTDKIVTLHAKPATSSGVRFSRQAMFPNGTTDRLAGIAYIQWQAGDLNRAPGNYSAEIEIYDTVAGSRETIYDLITLVIREDIGDIGPPYTPAPNPTSPPIGPDPTA
jgi:hypothetical protein